VDVSKHTIRSHTRPYRCSTEGCPSTSQGFGSKFELERHTNTVHRQQNIFCPVAGCNRAEDAIRKQSFHRADNLTDHLQRRHPNFASPGAKLHLATPSAESPLSHQKRNEGVTGSAGKRKRRLSVSRDDLEPWSRVKSLETELERRDVIEQDLRSEVKRLQVETETLMKIVANLTQKNA
jgi:hypothetical protein